MCRFVTAELASLQDEESAWILGVRKLRHSDNTSTTQKRDANVPDTTSATHIHASKRDALKENNMNEKEHKKVKT